MANVKLALCGIFVRLLQAVFSILVLFLEPYVLIFYDSDVSFKYILYCAVISTTYLLVCFILSLSKPVYLVTGIIQIAEILVAILWVTVFANVIHWRIHDDPCPTGYLLFYQQVFVQYTFKDMVPCYVSRLIVTLAFLCFFLFLVSSVLFGLMVVRVDVQQGQKRMLWLLRDNQRYWLMWLCFARGPLKEGYNAFRKEEPEETENI